MSISVSSARPTVSAIIATRNRAMLLREALDSVYAQEGLGTRFDVDVIVVDDASTDNTSEVLAQYPRARYIRFPANRGASAVRNAGIESATGSYVAFLDDDDVWLPRKLALQVSALEAHPEVGVAYSPFIIIPASRKWRYAKGSVPSGLVFPDRSAPSGSVFERLLFVNLCGIPASPLVRREALAKVGGFDESVQSAEDYDLWLRLAFRVPFLFVPGAVAVYRRADEGNMLTAVRSGRYEMVLRRVIERALALLPDTGESSTLKQRVRANCELRVAGLRPGEAEAWDHLRAGLTMWPELALIPSNRVLLVEIIARRAAHSDSPMARVSGMWNEINNLQRGLSLREQSQMRRLLAAAYWQVGVVQGKGIGHPTNVAGAAGAITRSLMLDPFAFRNWGALVRFAFRRAVRPARSDDGAGGQKVTP